MNMKVQGHVQIFILLEGGGLIKTMKVSQDIKYQKKISVKKLYTYY